MRENLINKAETAQAPDHVTSEPGTSACDTGPVPHGEGIDNTDKGAKLRLTSCLRLGSLRKSGLCCCGDSTELDHCFPLIDGDGAAPGRERENNSKRDLVHQTPGKNLAWWRRRKGVDFKEEIEEVSLG